MTNDKEERILIVTKAGVDAINEFIPVKIGWDYLPLAPKPQQHTDGDNSQSKKFWREQAIEQHDKVIALEAHIKELDGNQATENCPYRLQNCGVCP